MASLTIMITECWQTRFWQAMAPTITAAWRNRQPRLRRAMALTIAEVWQPKLRRAKASPTIARCFTPCAACSNLCAAKLSCRVRGRALLPAPMAGVTMAAALVTLFQGGHPRLRASRTACVILIRQRQGPQRGGPSPRPTSSLRLLQSATSTSHTTRTRTAVNTTKLSTQQNHIESSRRFFFRHRGACSCTKFKAKACRRPGGRRTHTWGEGLPASRGHRCLSASLVGSAASETA